MSFLDKENTPLTWDHDLPITEASHRECIRNSDRVRSRFPYIQQRGLLSTLLCFVFATSSILLFFEVHHLRGQIKLLSTSNYTGLDQTYHTPHSNYLPSIYTSENSTEADEAWEAIQGGHGIVTVDAVWARAQHLPESQPDGNDSSKRIYALEAYHVLHCLKTIRREYRHLQTGKKSTHEVKPEHLIHCFDAIRQSIICNTDDTLLYGWGDNKVGVGQVRKCRNWNALREWASEHTTCYSVDVPKGTSHFGKCDGGRDGIVL